LFDDFLSLSLGRGAGVRAYVALDPLTLTLSQKERE
jgi:hypothetical protein